MRSNQFAAAPAGARLRSRVIVFGVAAVMAVLGGLPQAAAGEGASVAPRFAGTEIRLSDWDGEAEVSHLWRLYPGGHATGVSHAMYLRGQHNYYKEVTDTGRWTVRGDVLCLAWTRLSGGGRHCYRVSVNGHRLLAVDAETNRVSKGTIHPVPPGAQP